MSYEYETESLPHNRQRSVLRVLIKRLFVAESPVGLMLCDPSRSMGRFLPNCQEILDCLNADCGFHPKGSKLRAKRG